MKIKRYRRREIETRKKADKGSKNQARTGGPRPGELARHPAEAERRARHHTQAHRPSEGHSATWINSEMEGAAEHEKDEENQRLFSREV